MAKQYNPFDAAFNCRVKQRFRMTYVRERTYFVSPSFSNAFCEMCAIRRAKGPVRVKFDLDERCTLVKCSLLRSIFWKDAIFSLREEDRTRKRERNEKKEEDNILFPRYPRVARNLKSARLFAENTSSLKTFFFLSCSRRFLRLLPARDGHRR